MCGGVEVRCVWCVAYLLVLLWVSHFRCRFVGRVATLICLLVTGVLRVLRQWSGPVPREPCRQVAPGRVCAGLGAEDFQCGGILFVELCPCPWPVLWNYVLAMPVYHCSVLRLWSVLCLWWGGCLTVVGRRLCRRRLHVWCRLQWGGLSGHVPVAVLEGKDCARNFRAVGVAAKPQWFRQRGWRAMQALEVSHPGVSKCLLRHGKTGRMGKMGENGGKWGEMGENGGKWGKTGENGGKQGGKWGEMRGYGMPEHACSPLLLL